MDVVLPIAIGALCGLLAGAPYLVAFARVRRTHAPSILPGFAALAVSILVIVVSLVVAWVVARGMIVPFAFALIVPFFIVVCVGAAWFLRRPRP